MRSVDHDQGRDPRPDPQSFLFVPGGDARKAKRARTTGAEAVVLDLEDAVPEERKESARQAVAEELASSGWATTRIGVRINAPSSPHADADLAAVLPHDVEWIFVPKVEDPADLRYVEHRVDAGPAATTVCAILETPKGVLHAAKIAAQSRVDALLFGSGDYSAELGIKESPGRAELDYPRAHVALVAACYGLLAIDAPFYHDIHDLVAAARDTRRGRQLGYHAKAAIHPSHVDVIHQAFQPDKRDIEWARRILDAHGAGGKEGRAAMVADGILVDRPIVAQARAVLAAAGIEES